MKIAVWGADTFIGSNICNYLLQYTKHDIFGVFVGNPPYRHMAGPMRSRARFDWQLTTEHHAAAYMRLCTENPDIVLVTTPMPSILSGKFNTCYIGSDPDQIGATRTFLSPEVFGPRQPRNTGFAQIICGATPPADQKKTVIYIKDLYDQLMLFLDSESRYGHATGFDTTTAQVWEVAQSRTTNIPQLQAVLHTLGWYELNTWFN